MLLFKEKYGITNILKHIFFTKIYFNNKYLVIQISYHSSLNFSNFKTKVICET